MKTILTDAQKEKLDNRPICSVPGCYKLVAHIVAKNHPRYPTWRRSKWIKERYPEVDDIWCCAKCHGDNTARKHGVKSAAHLTAKRHGLSLTQYNCKNHPYLWYREEVPYCENRDGRLGFVCNYRPISQEILNSIGFHDWNSYQFLQVDHIDGNHTHNERENLQTLCHDCHKLKTYMYGDHTTPGRKTRKISSI